MAQNDLESKYKALYHRAMAILVIITIFFLGGIANGFVMVENEGKMPVKATIIKSYDHHFPFADNSEVNYWYLADIIAIKNTRSSIGDVIMTISFIFLVYNINKWRVEERRLRL